MRHFFFIVIFMQVDEMTPSEADVLLAERLLERRSRAGSVLSDQQAQVGQNRFSKLRGKTSAYGCYKKDCFMTQPLRKKNDNLVLKSWMFSLEGKSSF
jgi:hypothetical protein